MTFMLLGPLLHQLKYSAALHCVCALLIANLIIYATGYKLNYAGDNWTWVTRRIWAAAGCLKQQHSGASALPWRQHELTTLSKACGRQK